MEHQREYCGGFANKASPLEIYPPSALASNALFPPAMHVRSDRLWCKHVRSLPLWARSVLAELGDSAI